MREILENCQKQLKQAQYPDAFRLRIHRALSWLKKADQAEDLDTKFISLWIAFNAAYAREVSSLGKVDRKTLDEFLLKICMLDEPQYKIYDLVWHAYSQPVRMLLENPYIFEPFWDFHNQKITEEEYLEKEQRAKGAFLKGIEEQNTSLILTVLFKRFYTLRNQILHGGATFNSSVNRSQLKDSCNILSLLIPAMIEIMLANHNEVDWGKPFYPLVNTTFDTSYPKKK